MALERMRIDRWPLFLECLQQELTYLPLTASFLGLYLYADSPAAWVAAPALFVAGASNFIYNFFMGKAVREKLEKRIRDRHEKQRGVHLDELRQHLSDRDTTALDAILTLEKALAKKIDANRDALEMTGTFATTYHSLTATLAEAGLDALRRKSLLESTVAELRNMGAGKEARAIAMKLDVLDERVEQVRQQLTDALAQIAVMDGGTGERTLQSLSRSLEDRLSFAAEIAEDAQPLLANHEMPALQQDDGEETAARPQVPGDILEEDSKQPSDTGRQRKRKRRRR